MLRGYRLFSSSPYNNKMSRITWCSKRNGVYYERIYLSTQIFDSSLGKKKTVNKFSEVVAHFLKEKLTQTVQKDIIL